MIKRLFDLVASTFGLIVFSPIFILVALAIKLQDGGPVLFKQDRVGLNGRLFKLYKFRSMTQSTGPSLTRSSDSRITGVGRFIRKYKIDELPQLLNVLKGDMSFVGPRPEIPKYVNLYTSKQATVLSFKPGITDPATINFRRESEILEQATDWEKHYIEVLMPQKIDMNLAYCQKANFVSDCKIIVKTVWLSFTGQ